MSEKLFDTGLTERETDIIKLAEKMFEIRQQLVNVTDRYANFPLSESYLSGLISTPRNLKAHLNRIRRLIDDAQYLAEDVIGKREREKILGHNKHG